MFQFSVPKCMAVGAIPKLLMLKQDMEPLQSTGRPFFVAKDAHHQATSITFTVRCGAPE